MDSTKAFPSGRYDYSLHATNLGLSIRTVDSGEHVAIVAIHQLVGLNVLVEDRAALHLNNVDGLLARQFHLDPRVRVVLRGGPRTSCLNEDVKGNGKAYQSLKNCINVLTWVLTNQNT